MGTDIHLVVEAHHNGQWKPVLPPLEVQDPWLKELVERDKDSPQGGMWKHALDVTWYDDRNYNLFAILADVRNGYGFGGVDKGDGFVPISDPKGLPYDLSPEHGSKYPREPEDEADPDESPRENCTPGGFWFGDHSHSWLTVRELLDYDWAQTTNERGVVNWEQFENWVKTQKGRGAPETGWCGWCSGTIIEEEEAFRILYGTQEHPETKSLNVQIQWSISYAEAGGRFYERILPVLQTLGPPEDVRIVFGFDS